MEKTTRERLLFAGAVLIQLVLGLYSFTAYPIEDVGTHARTVEPVLREQIYPLDYMPVSDTGLTYPVLFHYPALILNILGLNAVVAVRVIGLAAFAAFPLCMYLLGGIFDRKTGFYCLGTSVVVGNLAVLLAFSAFPQILAYDLLCMMLFFWFSKRFWISGIFLGLTLLAHSFVGPFALFCTLILLATYREYRKDTLRAIGTGLVVTLPWAFQYFRIFFSALEGEWHNTVWYGSMPGFIDLGTAISYLIRLNPVVLAAAFAALGYRHRKKLFFSLLFLVCLAFTVYHYTPAQLKFLDTLAFPTILLASVSMARIKDKKLELALVVLLAVSIAVPFWILHDYNSMFSVISEEEIEAARWLRVHDKDFSRIIVAGEPAKEVMFAAIADKYPMDAKLSDLEVYSDAYLRQIANRKRIIDGNYSLAAGYGVKYIIYGEEGCRGLDQIYS
ncbi:hypothetical protein GF351_05235, partial [Candidatus Woesearchaeota archaeon]|nr:hypothetical protein [Candidatus Woesearchaeota archaeon]